MILCLSIAGLYYVQSPDTKGTLIATTVISAILILYLILDLIFLLLSRKSADNYEINGKDNKGYADTEGGNLGKSTIIPEKGDGNVKWVSNYVPYGDYPDGKKVIGETTTTSVSVADEKQNGIEKWQKNYVPYEEEDSNKNEQNN